MTDRRTDRFIESLAADAVPVKPLRPPGRRAIATLAALAVPGLLAIALFATSDPFAVRRDDPPFMVALEMLAILATGLGAVLAAFHIAVPGRSRRWLLVPLPPLALWLALSGMGCFADFARDGSVGSIHMDCLLFIVATSALLAVPLIWPLSRACPIDPLPVALLGGLGLAALSAFVLQFFHEFEVTLVDLATHLVAIAIVVALTSLFRRRALRAA